MAGQGEGRRKPGIGGRIKAARGAKRAGGWGRPLSWGMILRGPKSFSLAFDCTAAPSARSESAVCPLQACGDRRAGGGKPWRDACGPPPTRGRAQGCGGRPMPTQACDLAAAFAPFDPGPYPLGAGLAFNRRPAGMSTCLGAWTYSRAARMGATIAGCASLRRLDREAATMPPRRAGDGLSDPGRGGIAARTWDAAREPAHLGRLKPGSGPA